MTVLGGSTIIAVFIALLVVQVVLAIQLRRQGADQQAVRLDDGRLECQQCRTVNEPEYLFCRECVMRLRRRSPVAPLQSSSGRSPLP